jgi:hypothetical protein
VQEVDAKLYEEYYGPLLEASGYSGAYANKEGKVVEGCALFVRSSRSVCLCVCVWEGGCSCSPIKGPLFCCSHNNGEVCVALCVVNADWIGVFKMLSWGFERRQRCGQHQGYPYWPNIDRFLASDWTRVCAFFRAAGSE